MEMVPTASGTRISNLNSSIQKAVKEKGINPTAYEKYMMSKYGNTSLNIL